MGQANYYNGMATDELNNRTGLLHLPVQDTLSGCQHNLLSALWQLYKSIWVGVLVTSVILQIPPVILRIIKLPESPASKPFAHTSSLSVLAHIVLSPFHKDMPYASHAKQYFRGNPLNKWGHKNKRNLKSWVLFCYQFHFYPWGKQGTWPVTSSFIHSRTRLLPHKSSQQSY